MASDAADRHPDQAPTFHIGEVQAAQRYYNESPFVNRIRDVRRSLGKPKANLSRLRRARAPGGRDRLLGHRLVPVPGRPAARPAQHAERVTLHREGMDLDELAFHFRDKNAVVNDDGRLDASELEVRLLSDPSALITEMDDAEETQSIDDATEEDWGSA